MNDHTTSPTVTPDPDRDGVILHLPEITYLDTQTWAVDVGLTTEGLAALRTLLGAAPVEPLPPADQTALREVAAQAIRDAACTGDCGQTEEECRAERIQPFVWRHGVLAVVEGSPEQFADAVFAAVLPATTNHDTDTSTDLRAEVEQWRATFGRDALPGALRRLERAETERDSLGREADRLRNDWVEMRDRAERAEADRAAVLREAADIAEAQRQFEPAYGARKSAQVSENVGILRVADELRRVADETAATATQARRGDQFEAWLKQQRDSFGWQGANDRRLFDTLDGILDSYRLHADTGTPLGEHVCEARVVGDCECLEQPAAGARQDGAQPS